jgi:hypothetical protein
VRTYQGRLSLDAQASDALEAYGALFGRAVRTLYAHRRRKRELAKPEFMRLFDLTSRQYNAVKFTLDGMEASIRELRPGRIANLKHRIDAVVAKIDKTSRPAKIHHLRRRLGSLRLRLKALEGDSGVHLCFGSRKLFNAQHHLEENGFASHADWRKAWTAKRSSQFFVLGSKDESAGCQGCVLTHLGDDRFLARLRLTAHDTARGFVRGAVRSRCGPSGRGASPQAGDLVSLCVRCKGVAHLRDDPGARYPRAIAARHGVRRRRSQHRLRCGLADRPVRQRRGRMQRAAVACGYVAAPSGDGNRGVREDRRRIRGSGRQAAVDRAAGFCQEEGPTLVCERRPAADALVVCLSCLRADVVGSQP